MGSPGAPGQVPQSAGPGQPPTWGTASGLGTADVVLNFGAVAVRSRRFVFTTPVTVGKTLIMGASAANGDELEFDQFVCSARVTATDTVEAFVSATGPVSGQRTFTIVIA